MSVTTSTPSTEIKTDELKVEASVLIRTAEHIARDLDQFSTRIRRIPLATSRVTDIEKHLGQARRNCAEATSIADIAQERLVESMTDRELDVHSARLRDAYARLALADAAYLKAFEIAAAE